MGYYKREVYAEFEVLRFFATFSIFFLFTCSYLQEGHY